jgi:hypothetical protein
VGAGGGGVDGFGGALVGFLKFLEAAGELEVDVADDLCLGSAGQVVGGDEAFGPGVDGAGLVFGEESVARGEAGCASGRSGGGGGGGKGSAFQIRTS